MTAQIFTTHPKNRDMDIARIVSFLRAALPGKPLRVDIKEAKASRSQDQNAALWGVAYPPLMAHMGLRGAEECEELHATMCGLYFGWRETEICGHTVRKPKRTTTRDEQGKRDLIDKARMADFYAFVQQRGAEVGCYVPDPDPAHGIKGRAQMEYYEREAA